MSTVRNQNSNRQDQCDSQLYSKMASEQNDPSVFNEENNSNASHQEIDVNKCKNCRQQYKSLLKHLGQRKFCKNSYSQEEMNTLHFRVKAKSNILKRVKEKLSYQQNKETILKKRKKHYEENKEGIKRKKFNYYQQHSEKLLSRKADFYKKKKQRTKQQEETGNFYNGS